MTFVKTKVIIRKLSPFDKNNKSFFSFCQVRGFVAVYFDLFFFKSLKG